MTFRVSGVPDITTSFPYATFFAAISKQTLLFARNGTW